MAGVRNFGSGIRAAALLAWLSIPTLLAAQQGVSFDGRAGLAIPLGGLADLVDPGPHVGLQMGIPLTERIGLNLGGNVGLFPGAGLTEGHAPDLSLWRYGGGIHAHLLRPDASRWVVTADLGIGATTVDSEDFLAEPEDGRLDFRKTYFGSSAGLRLGYRVSDRVSLTIGAEGQWTGMDADDTDVLQALDPATIDRLSSAWNVPLTLGVSIRTGRRRVEPTPPPAQAPTRSTPPPPAASDPLEGERAAALRTLAERVHFEFDQYDIRPETAAALNRKVEVLRRYPDLRLVIEGHCDEWGSVEYNLALGHRRATAVAEYLVAQGIDRSRFDTTSFGKERPLDPASNDGAWAQNRRAEFVVVNPDVIGLLSR